MMQILLAIGWNKLWWRQRTRHSGALWLFTYLTQLPALLWDLEVSPPANLPSLTSCLISGTSVDLWKIGLSCGIVSLLTSCCCCIKRCCCKKSKKDEAETPDGEAAVNLQEVMLLSRSLTPHSPRVKRTMSEKLTATQNCFCLHVQTAVWPRTCCSAIVSARSSDTLPCCALWCPCSPVWTTGKRVCVRLCCVRSFVLREPPAPSLTAAVWLLSCRCTPLLLQCHQLILR